MPRNPLHVLIWSREHKRYDLYTQGHLAHGFSEEDEDGWLAQLCGLTAFAFHGVSGSLNVYLEERSGGKQYWYAYHSRERRTHKRYLGQRECVTFTRLEEVAKALNSESSSTFHASKHSEDERKATSQMSGHVPSGEVLSGMEVLSTRLSHPLLPSGLLKRERLLSRLDAARFHRLTLLSASAGWGKTTLLSTWAFRSQFPIAWLSLDELDNGPTRLWVSAIAALRTCLPGVGKTALAMLQSPQPPPLTTVLTTLINELSTQDVPTFLLLEDYHLIDEQAIHDSLLFMLEHLPAHLHLVLSSRIDPPLALARLRARGQLLELRDADLRFEEGEAAQFLRHTMDISLENDEIGELTRRTGGWIAGLQLAGLSLQRREDRADFVRGFTGGHRYVLDYVQEDILARLSPTMQDFVLSISILHQMSASLCQAVTEEAASQEMLEAIERANLFLVPLDDERQWYRFHDLFREALLARLQTTQPESVSLLHQRAARWYEEHGEFREAISHWLAAHDFSSAVGLMKQKVQQFWLRGEAATMYQWIMALPDAVVREHAAFVLTATYYMVNAAAHTVAVQITHTQRQAEQLISRVEHTVFPKDGGAERDTQLPESEYTRIRRRLQLLRLSIEMDKIELHGGYERFIHITQQAELLELDDEMVWQMIPLAATFILNFSLRLQGGRVVSLLLEAKRRADVSGDHYAMIKIRQWIAVCGLTTGWLNQMQEECLEGLALIEQNGGYDLLKGYFLQCLGLVYYYRNQLDKARLVLREILPIVDTWQQLDLLVFGYVHLARVELAAKDLEAAEQFLEEAENPSRMTGFSPSTTIPHMIALRAQWFLMQGKVTEAARLTEEVAQIQDGSVYFHFPEFFTLIHVYFAQQRYSLAVETLERCSQYFDNRDNMVLTIHFLSRYVAALYLAGKREQAGAVALRLLSMTEPDGYIRVYLDEGEPMKQVLKALLNTPQNDEEDVTSIPRTYISTLLSAFEQEEQKCVVRKDASQFAGLREQEAQQLEHLKLVDPLTERPVMFETLSPQEQRVLRLLSAGRSNGEIASDLVVSINTVKAHVKKIYSKLQVNNRVAAIEVARAMNLL